MSYDLVLFGVTGFTGKLAVEYLKSKNYSVKWAVCGRNEDKVKGVLGELGVECPIEVADLVVEEKSADFEKLRQVVKKTKVVITCAGPFEKYGQSLLQLCVEEGVHYADITGESDFVRKMIEKYHLMAIKNGATIVPHCGNDCIPWDLSVHAMSEVAKKEGGALVECKTFTELPPTFAASGGTITTAIYQLGKSRGDKGGVSFDPLVMSDKGEKSNFAMKNASPKGSTYCEEFGRNGAPWIMAPVMANCVRRSNALLGYNENLTYSECQLALESFAARMNEMWMTGLIGASTKLPFLQRFLNAPGEGPPKADMEAGWLKVHGRGVITCSDGASKNIKSTYTFNQDTGYLQTAHMLVESGMLLVEKPRTKGVITPAVAFGTDIVKKLETAIGAKLEIAE